MQSLSKVLKQYRRRGEWAQALIRSTSNMTFIIFQQELPMSLVHAVVLITGANRAEEVLADEATRPVKKSLSSPYAAYLEPTQ
jgi:kynureninase